MVYNQVCKGINYTANLSLQILSNFHTMSVCVALKRNVKHDITPRHGHELFQIMDLFDSIFPNASKNTVVDSEHDEYHERWIGNRFRIIFCFNEVCVLRINTLFTTFVEKLPHRTRSI